MSRFSWKDKNSSNNDSTSDNLGNAKRFSWQKDDAKIEEDNDKFSNDVTDKNGADKEETSKEKIAKSEQPKPPSSSALKNEKESHKNTWRILAGRQQGTSHVSDNSPCEDYYSTKSIGNDLLIFVADGAGSAKHGGNGAKLACESAMNFVLSALTKNTLKESLAPDIANDVVLHIQQELTNHIDKMEKVNKNEEALTLRDFACTFLGVMIVNGQTLFMQVGDGAIVVNFAENAVDSSLTVAIKPMQGEYANMTHFITDSKACDYLETQIYQKTPSQVAVMTDGLQRLALNLADFTPHLPFFAPFFNALATTENDNDGEQALQTALDNFLNSKLVNARTDDDKTLVLVQAV